MEVPFDNVQADMEVYGSDGEKIGNVGGIERETDVTPAGPGPADAILTERRYLRVNRSGLLDAGGGHLYIPESAISAMTFAHGVVVNCTKDECIDRYIKKPNVL